MTQRHRRTGVIAVAGLLALASAINDRDMRARTLDGLGLTQQAPAALQAALREGF